MRAPCYVRLLNVQNRVISRTSLPRPSIRYHLSLVRSSSTWSDAARTMPPLSPDAEKAIARLRAYVPPPTSYDSVPLSRRAAVLLLLYADPNGDLKVVLTIRAKTLSSFAGHAAFPGGKADTNEETAFETARREATEEIGLPDIGQPLLSPFRVEHICELPANLARNELVVRPCVALLHSHDAQTGKSADPETALIPRLDAKEVAAVFTAPFHDFLKLKQRNEHEHGERGHAKDDWYQGSWTYWHETDWRMHQFYVPVSEKNVTKPRNARHQSQTTTAAVEQLEKRERSGDLKSYLVFGMTARILVDAARLAYDEEPEFEHNSHFGDEAIIGKLRRIGRLDAVKRPGDELTRETMQKAAKLS
ncbi:Peroxisomal coenzyme A diphosphatase 1, peroxisomal [Talaromyces islandicus]|uniref:Peroxisomal coenzyme A diphosphatase 1, peroxisomal n=1 Tax=Talaromyces islandicus TaxID=28573 RepID=A0A0U1LYC0_TALIS|nr:Peroxisomal coenzyme A diphosphatase 1, peroxisomal [Talaromyces islandicus]